MRRHIATSHSPVFVPVRMGGRRRGLRIFPFRINTVLHLVIIVIFLFGFWEMQEAEKLYR